MIFLVLGSQKYQFNRLLIALDQLKAAGKIQEEIIAQSGYSTYTPQHFQAIDFLEKPAFDHYLDQANLVICHGGTGIIITAIKQGKKVIAVPRSKQFNEHIDNHQFEIVRRLSDFDLIEACENPDELESMIKKARTKQYRLFKSHNQVFIHSLRKEIQSLVNEN